jgi:hypothetical protein
MYPDPHPHLIDAIPPRKISDESLRLDPEVEPVAKYL